MLYECEKGRSHFIWQTTNFPELIRIGKNTIFPENQKTHEIAQKWPQASLSHWLKKLIKKIACAFTKNIHFFRKAFGYLRYI